MNVSSLKTLCKLIRYYIITSTNAAGSGHPTTSLSAVELMTTLFFGGHLKYDVKNPKHFANDRVIFSKGHASPLLYALYHAAGVISYDQLMTLRKFNSIFEGHPTPRFPYVDVASGSLGQGLSVGVGMAMGIRLRMKDERLKIKRLPKVWVLLGDSEMAEGQIWEAMEIASYYKLDNLVGILDVNRMGQRGETMLGWDLKTYEKRIASFGWKTIIVNDGHDLKKVENAFSKALHPTPYNLLPIPYSPLPTMIITKTVKGKGVSFMENKDGWHGKPVPKERLQEALEELGQVDLNVRGEIVAPKFQISNSKLQNPNSKIKETYTLQPTPYSLQPTPYSLHPTPYTLNDRIATREAYGDALVELGKSNSDVVVLDGETSNSTYAEKFKKVFPERFFEMFIAEQNMISVSLGLSKIGFTVYSSSFAAFLTRAFDQLRIAQYSHPNLKLCGSHAGVSIGEDGPSQMALEDLSMVRSLLESVVLYPSDAISALKLTVLMADYQGISYIRTTREKTPILYNEREKFEIGGSKIHYSSSIKHLASGIRALIIAAGITLHEALKAQKQLTEEGIETVVMDCYSVKPIDSVSINQLIKKINNIVVVEDHYPAGGLGEAVLTALSSNIKYLTSNISFSHLCVRKIPTSGKPAELLHYEEIDAEAIIKTIKKLL